MARKLLIIWERLVRPLKARKVTEGFGLGRDEKR